MGAGIDGDDYVSFRADGCLGVSFRAKFYWVSVFSPTAGTHHHSSIYAPSPTTWEQPPRGKLMAGVLGFRGADLHSGSCSGVCFKHVRI